MAFIPMTEFDLLDMLRGLSLITQLRPAPPAMRPRHHRRVLKRREIAALGLNKRKLRVGKKKRRA